MELSEERQQVLRMVETGNVSPRDGAMLLLALGEIDNEAPLRSEPQQVLRMIEEANVSVEDGVRLLMALGPAAEVEPSHHDVVSSVPPTRDDAGMVRFTVKSNDGRVQLAIPLEVARMVLPLFDLPHAALLGEHGRDIHRVREALRSGETGEVMDFHDEESGHSVHIVIG